MVSHPEQYQLSNGIPVLFKNFDGLVASVYWWVKTGSIHESSGQEGYAHFLEHMNFKDTDAKNSGKASIGEIARAIEGFGGDVNAYTSFENTVYYANCSEIYWEKIVDIIGRMAKPQKFLKLDLDREKEVILEEYKRYMDSPARQINQALFNLTYPRHPYGRPVIGKKSSIEKTTVGSLHSFYRRQYSAAKMGIVLVGPFSTKKDRKKSLLKLLEKRFGSRVIPKSKSLPKSSNHENPLRKDVQFKYRSLKVSQSTLAISFRVPNIHHEDIPALDVMVSLLAHGELAYLYRDLFKNQSLITDLSGGLYALNESGMLYFQLDFDKLPNAENVFQEFLKGLENARKGEFQQEDLERVIRSEESEKLFVGQTVDSYASRLGTLGFHYGDLSFDDKYLNDLRSVTIGDLKKVAQKYLAPGRMSVVLVDQSTESSMTANSARNLVHQHLNGSKKEKPKSKKTGDDFSVDSWVSEDGIQVVHIPRADSNLVSVHASVLGGLRLELNENSEHWGMSHLMAHCWDNGTDNKSVNQIAEIVEACAARLESFSGRNSVGLELHCLKRDWRELSSLFSEVLFQPSFDPIEIGHSKRVIEDSIKSVKDYSSYHCLKLFLENLYDTHPYGKIVIGAQESLNKITQDTLKHYHREWVHPKRLVLSISGAITKDEINLFLKRLKDFYSDYPLESFPNEIPEDPDLLAPRWTRFEEGKQQKHILMGGFGLRQGDEDRYIARIVSNILGGQSGRLFIELREKKSLAYSVSPTSMEGIEKGFIGTYIATSHKKEKEAIKGIQKVYEMIEKRGVKQAELERAREYFLGKRAMELQSDSSLASLYGLRKLYGLALETQDDVKRAIKKVSSKDVQKFIQKYLLDPPLVTSVVG